MNNCANDIRLEIELMSATVSKINNEMIGCLWSNSVSSIGISDPNCIVVEDAKVTSPEDKLNLNIKRN